LCDVFTRVIMSLYL